MAVYAENNYYLDIDGTNLSPYVTNISLNPTNSPVVTTAGSGVDHVQREEGLDDTSGSFIVRADDAAAYSLALLKGKHTVTIGLMGNGSGKPKHVQSMILSGIQFTTVVTKDMVTYTVNLVGADAPTTDQFAGGVWA